MTPNLRAQATKLAKRFYTRNAQPDVNEDGEPVFIAETIELPGCIGQGNTIQEALEDLKDAEIDYIESLLEVGLSVPESQLMGTRTNEKVFNLPIQKEQPGITASPVLLGSFVPV